MAFILQWLCINIADFFVSNDLIFCLATRVRARLRALDRIALTYVYTGVVTAATSRGALLKLVILESGAKARTIKKYLGKEWIVDACNGHVQDLPSGRGTKDSSKAMWSSKADELPNPPWSWTDKAEQVMDKIINKAEKSGVEEVYIATDPDREGEFIAWRLSEILSDFNSVHRISFNEITKSAVLDSISDPRGLDMSLVEAAIVRRLMDRLVGFRCSKFCRSWKLKSMGRVQTPTLGYIVDKEIEREAHIPIEYHSVNAQSNGVEIKVKFHESDDKDAWRDDADKYFPDRTSDLKKARKAFEALQNSGDIKLISSKEGKASRKPQPPFTTDTLLQTSSSILGWSISKTSNIASSLYQSGHITYIRTDSTRTNKKARDDVRSLIKANFGEEYLGKGVGETGSKNKDGVQDAHEAIRPTNPKIQTIDGENDERKLYNLIWSRFAASQMSNSIRERRSLIFNCNDMIEEIYGTSSWRTHSGWEEVFRWTSKTIIEAPPEIGFEIGSFWKIDTGPEITTDFTKPPRRYTESSIIQQMKKDGIGRPSTYVTTVSKIVDRGYVYKEGSSLIPTDDGKTLWIEVAPFYNQTELFSEGLFSYDFTSNMEMRLDNIESGKSEASVTWSEFSDVFREMHNFALEKRREKPTIRQIQYVDSILSRMDDKKRVELIGTREVSDLTGEEIREFIDSIDKDLQSSIPPSEKQLSTIIRLSDKLGLELSDFLSGFGISDISELTGGRDGSASEAIGSLIEMDRSSPATERQVNTISSMCENLQMPIEQAMEIVQAESLLNITKSEASNLISNLKKMIASNKRNRKT